MTIEEEASKYFRSKNRVTITQTPTAFNDLCIKRTRHGIFKTTQEKKIGKLMTDKTQKKLASKRDLVQCIGVNVRRGIYVPFSLLTHVIETQLRNNFRLSRELFCSCARRDSRNFIFSGQTLPRRGWYC